MNILIVNQSVIDMCASVFTLLTAVVEVDGTRMSRDSIYDQFVCRVWLTRTPLSIFIGISTYGILLTALERYAAVIYHVWYHNNVRMYCRGVNATGDASPAIFGQPGTEYLIFPQSSACTLALQKYLCIAMGQLVGCIHSSCNVLSRTLNWLK